MMEQGQINEDPNADGQPAQAPAPVAPAGAAAAPTAGERPQPRRPRPDMDALRATRERRKRRARIALVIGAAMVAIVIAAAITDSALSSRFGKMYSEQPWVRVARAYRDIDEGAVLAVHREQAVARLDKEFLNREGWVIGFVTAVEEPRQTEIGLKVRILVDAPNFAEVVNLFDDDVRVEADPGMAAGIAPGDMVVARGRIDNFSRWGLWMTADSIRPLTPVEKHYVWKVIPPTSYMREPLGFDALARKK